MNITITAKRIYAGNQKAQAIVEFALILPIILATVMCIFEFGLVLKNYLGMNYALGRAAKEAALCRGQENADMKVLSKLLENSFLLDTRNLFIVGPSGTAYGPYKLDSNKYVRRWSDDSVIAASTEFNQDTTSVFFYNDRQTPMDLRDDQVSNSANASYSKISIKYVHTMINAKILGLEKQGTFNLELTSRTRLAPQ